MMNSLGILTYAFISLNRGVLDFMMNSLTLSGEGQILYIYYRGHYEIYCLCADCDIISHISHIDLRQLLSRNWINRLWIIITCACCFLERCYITLQESNLELQPEFLQGIFQERHDSTQTDWVQSQVYLTYYLGENKLHVAITIIFVMNLL